MIKKIKGYDQFVNKINENIQDDKISSTEEGYLREEDYDNEISQEEGDEEEGGDVFKRKLKEVADKLGVVALENSVEYEGKKIIFPSETEMFHVDKKKFKTSDEVVNYLKTSDRGEEPKAFEGKRWDMNNNKSYKNK